MNTIKWGVLTLCYVSASLIILSCNKEKDFDCFKSTGSIRQEQRELPFFTKISLNDNINLVFVAAEEQKIVVEAGSNLLPKIRTRIVGDSLILENLNYCDWVRSYDKQVKVYIHGNPGLRLYNNGYGTVSGKVTGSTLFIKSWSNENMEIDIDLDFLWLETFKFGSSTLTGQANTVYIFRHSVGIVDMRSMQRCNELLIHDHGQGLSYVRADSALTVRLFDSGSLEIYGQPMHKTIDIDKNGSVNLIR